MAGRDTKLMDPSSTITVTFSDCVENAVGMEKLGNKTNNGVLLTPEYLQLLASELENATYYPLDDEAGILICRQWLANADVLYNELVELDWDRKGLMRGRVVNRVARHNLCFTDATSEPDYPAGKGRVYSFQLLPNLSVCREAVANLLPFETTIYAEGNHYYNTQKTYIGFHGDTERSFVVGLRLGADFPLHYRKYHNGEPISDVTTFNLEGGDLYIMSYKAVGNDWKKRKIPTYRHAAGNLTLFDKK